VPLSHVLDFLQDITIYRNSKIIFQWGESTTAEYIHADKAIILQGLQRKKNYGVIQPQSQKLWHI